MDNETLLVIVGDHGMTETGDHGGDSQLELETALIFYSKKKNFIKKSGIEETRQINLTPTLALLLGIPIPFSNLGIVIDSMFDNRLDSVSANYDQVITHFFFIISIQFEVYSLNESFFYYKVYF